MTVAAAFRRSPPPATPRSPRRRPSCAPLRPASPPPRTHPPAAVPRIPPAETAPDRRTKRAAPAPAGHCVKYTASPLIRSVAAIASGIFNSSKLFTPRKRFGIRLQPLDSTPSPSTKIAIARNCQSADRRRPARTISSNGSPRRKRHPGQRPGAGARRCNRWECLFCSSACSTPRCAIPRANPPPSATPTFGGRRREPASPAGRLCVRKFAHALDRASAASQPFAFSGLAVRLVPDPFVYPMIL